MLRWALTGADADKVDTLGNAAHDFTAMYETGKETILNKIDRINNIYDLEGNGFEWTAEAKRTYNRSIRQGDYDYQYNSLRRNTSCYRGEHKPNGPTNAYDLFTSRPIIYVK